jgi:hypothetical protein
MRFSTFAALEALGIVCHATALSTVPGMPKVVSYNLFRTARSPQTATPQAATDVVVTPATEFLVCQLIPLPRSLN